MMRIGMAITSQALTSRATQANRMLLRVQSTHASSSTPSQGVQSHFTPSSSSSHQGASSAPLHHAKTPPSKHKLLYRQILPPLARVLAYGSIVYFSLHLAWQYLDGREQKKLEEDVRQEMEAQVRQQLERKGVVTKEGRKEGSGSWWGWLGGK